MQSNFVGMLSDTIYQGIGSPADANIEEDSICLKAPETEQQPDVLSLPIANSSSRNILSPFL